MELASLALGIIPLAGCAIKLYGKARKKLRVFRHYTKQIRELRKHIDVQREFFLNETHLLLKIVLDDFSLIEAMLGDPNHHKWHSEELESELKMALMRSYPICKKIILDIFKANEQLQNSLECFDEFESHRFKNETLKAAVHRLRDAIKITWDKTKVEEHIKSLQVSNACLGRLREQIYQMQKPGFSNSDLKPQLPQEYADFGMIRRASKAFHRALENTWSMSNDVQTRPLRHNVRLFVDATVTDAVCMNVAVICRDHGLEGQVANSSLVKLQVRSRALDWSKIGLLTPHDSTISDNTSDECATKRRKISFLDKYRGTQISSKASKAQLKSEKRIASSQVKDLSKADLCEVFFVRNICATRCLGYIEDCSGEMFRHSIYKHIIEVQNPQDFISMDQILGQPTESSPTIVEQLKLARSLVAAVLKFHSTPWLAQYLTLHNISFLRADQAFSQCLSTLNLDVEFQTSDFENTPGSSSQGHENSRTHPSEPSPSHPDNEKLSFGVRNKTLWSLGTILLQIGHWSQIEPRDVPTVRKLSYQNSSLGPRYQSLTQRCLECDFGQGDDLSRPLLQQAIYEKLFCELGRIITVSDIDD